MSESLQIITVLALYFLLFGWVGYRRGSLSELIVAIVAIGGYFIIQRFQRVVVTILNLSGKFIAFARGGGLSGDNPDAILLIRDAPNIVSPDMADTVVFLIWAVLLLLTYLITNRLAHSRRNRSDASAALLGIVNGIFYFSIFIPLLITIFQPDGPGSGAGTVLGNMLKTIDSGFGEIWGSVGQQQPMLLAFFLTLLLVLIAGTLRAPKTNPK